MDCERSGVLRGIGCGAKRTDVVIATKVGMEMAPDRQGLSAAHIARSAEDSLRRLQTDYIDLYFSHRDDASVPMEETLGAYQKLIAQGKVRAIGASNFTAARLADALALSRKSGLPRYEALQPHYNLYARADYESALEPLCLQQQIGVVSYFALASGFLTGKYRAPADAAKSARGKGIVETFLNERGFKILAALDKSTTRIGRRHRVEFGPSCTRTIECRRRLRARVTDGRICDADPIPRHFCGELPYFSLHPRQARPANLPPRQSSSLTPVNTQWRQKWAQLDIGRGKFRFKKKPGSTTI
jgi:Aldo/keto reductase family